MEKLHLKNNTYQVWERGTVWFQGTEEECDKYILENRSESKAIPVLSDEEIEKAALEYKFKVNQEFFCEGAKWYREQLKLKTK